MMSSAMEETFRELGRAITGRAADTFQRRANEALNDVYARGLGTSSMTIQVLNRAAAEVFESAARDSYSALMEANLAEAPQDVGERSAQLERLLLLQLSELKDALTASHTARTTPVADALSNKEMVTTALGEFHKVIERTSGELAAMVRIGVRTAANRPPSGGTQQNNYFGANANIGAFTTGAHSAANVSQTVSQAGREDLKVAVDSLIQLLEAARGTAPEVGDAIELLAEVKTEAAKLAPNRLKIGGALTAISAVVSLVAKAPEAFTNVMATWTALKIVLGSS